MVDFGTTILTIFNDLTTGVTKFGTSFRKILGAGIIFSIGKSIAAGLTKPLNAAGRQIALGMKKELGIAGKQGAEEFTKQFTGHITQSSTQFGNITASMLKTSFATGGKEVAKQFSENVLDELYNYIDDGDEIVEAFSVYKNAIKAAGEDTDA
ncbi:MAG: hypothetical protein MJ199_00295 [Bacilli bacterium]|nr:hypothetical protein [Bacilli bacterium]